jgi:hypothetical protein
MTLRRIPTEPATTIERRNGKWAKITRTGEKYTWALGFGGQIKATHMSSSEEPRAKELAKEGCQQWLDS